MKKTALFLVMGSMFASMSVSASGLTCAQKQKAIETEISYAKAHNNTYKLEGLNQALADVKQYCSDSALKAKYEHKVQEKERKVSKAERELKEAQLRGDPSEIAKKQYKLQKAVSELAEAKARL